MAEISREATDAIRRKWKLPLDTPAAKVWAAVEASAIRRAGAVGLPWNATFAQIEDAERLASAATAARKVAAAGAVGHEIPVAVEEEEEWHPALRPVSVTAQLNTSKAIDWTSALRGGDE